MDAGFLSIETREMPMHVGSLMLFRPPEGAGESYLRQVYADCIKEREYRPPFNQKLEYVRDRLGLPHWVDDTEFDLEYHLRHSALPKPGRYRELFVLVSRLHGILLDRSRPLWEYHVIEGLQSGQFALYAKFHHSLLDGIAGMRMIQAALSEDPAEQLPHPWVKHEYWSRRSKKRAEPTKTALASVAEAVQQQLGVLPGVARALAKTVSSMQRPSDERMALPFEAPRSALNTKVTGARRFVAQSYSIERVKAVGAAFGATVNDVILAMVAGAIRSYLEEYAGGAPDRPLTAMAPVSVRPKDGEDLGNAASAVLVNLGTHIADPVKRMTTIQASMRDGKALIKELSFNEVMLYTILMATPLMVPALMGLGARFPATNIVVSNVPGPPRPLYWNGAKLDGMYPASIVYDGMALNVTVTSYAGSLDFGVVACRRSLPRVQRIIDFLEESLAELEQAGGI
jgi:diacylglycerol O-acyltransferase